VRPASYGAAVVNINSKSAARKKVREAQMKANEARLEREHHNVDDAASFLVELDRLGAVDEWEQGRIVEIRAEGERREMSDSKCCSSIPFPSALVRSAPRRGFGP
jgi:hypothetical protein